MNVLAAEPASSVAAELLPHQPASPSESQPGPPAQAKAWLRSDLSANATTAETDQAPTCCQDSAACPIVSQSRPMFALTHAAFCACCTVMTQSSAALKSLSAASVVPTYVLHAMHGLRHKACHGQKSFQRIPFLSGQYCDRTHRQREQSSTITPHQVQPTLAAPSMSARPHQKFPLPQLRLRQLCLCLKTSFSHNKYLLRFKKQHQHQAARLTCYNMHNKPTQGNRHLLVQLHRSLPSQHVQCCQPVMMPLLLTSKRLQLNCLPMHLSHLFRADQSPGNRWLAKLLGAMTTLDMSSVMLLQQTRANCCLRPTAPRAHPAQTALRCPL